MPSARTSAADVCCSGPERTAPIRSCRRLALIFRSSNVALVAATRSRMIAAEAGWFSMSHALQRISPGVFQTEVRQSDLKGGTHHRRMVLAYDAAVRVLAREFEQNYIVHRDYIALHAADVGDLRNATHPVPHALYLDDQVDCTDDLGSDRASRQVSGSHLY